MAGQTLDSRRERRLRQHVRPRLLRPRPEPRGRVLRRMLRAVAAWLCGRFVAPVFLDVFLERDLGELQRSWPSDREYVLARDPEMASVDARLLPWNQD